MTAIYGYGTLRKVRRLVKSSVAFSQPSDPFRKVYEDNTCTPGLCHRGALQQRCNPDRVMFIRWPHVSPIPYSQSPPISSGSYSVEYGTRHPVSVSKLWQKDTTPYANTFSSLRTPNIFFPPRMIVQFVSGIIKRRAASRPTRVIRIRSIASLRALV